MPNLRPSPALLLLPLALAACTGPRPWIEGGPRQSQVLQPLRLGVLQENRWEWRGGPPGYVIRASHRALTLDCGGLPLAIDGGFNHLTVSNCARVTVNGSSNRVTAELPEAGSLLVNGRYNQVRWHAAPGATVATKSISRTNDLIADAPAG